LAIAIAIKKEMSSHPKELLELYDKLIETNPKVERKGSAMPYTSLNGHMFSFIAKDGSFGLRLPEKARESFLKKYKTKLCEAYGVVLKEYVLVPDKLFKNPKELKPYFDLSFEYINSLKPRQAKKSKK
jgi:hypothetical protein